MMLSAIEHKRTRQPGLIDPDVQGYSLGDEVGGLIRWYRASSLLPYLDDGDYVTIWEDESDSAEHATQGQVIFKPVFKLDIANGHPVIRYSVPFQTQQLNTQPVIENLGTWFVVWSREDNTNEDSILDYTRFGGHSYLQYASDWHVFLGASTVVAMPIDTFFLKCCVYDNVNYKRYTNGGAEANQVGSGDMTFQTIGGAWPGGMLGDIAELAMFDTNLSNANRQKVETYLNTKYALW